MVNLKKGHNWGRTEIKNWISTELKWEGCMEQSCKQQSSLGSKVPLDAVVSDPEVPLGYLMGSLASQAPWHFKEMSVGYCG